MRTDAKKSVKSILPSSIYGGLRDIWRAVEKIVSSIHLLVIPILKGLPDVIIHYGHGIGDDLLCTAILHELRVRNRGVIWMMSNRPELYAGLDSVDRVIPPNNLYRRFAKFWRRDFPELEYSEYDRVDQSVPPKRHIIAEFCATADISGPVSLRPYLTLTEKEKAQSAWASGRVVIQSSGLAADAPMLNKEWYPERFQEVIDMLRGEFEFVQLGSKYDPPLQQVTDLRGITNLREAAAILHHAKFYIGGVGFLMHLARAVECPSVIVYGGREAPWQSGYICNINLYSPVSCAPCWRWNTCDFNRKCMTDITPQRVLQGVRELLQRPRNPLKTERMEILGFR